MNSIHTLNTLKHLLFFFFPFLVLKIEKNIEMLQTTTKDISTWLVQPQAAMDARTQFSRLLLNPAGPQSGKRAKVVLKSQNIISNLCLFPVQTNGITQHSVGCSFHLGLTKQHIHPFSVLSAAETGIVFVSSHQYTNDTRGHME